MIANAPPRRILHPFARRVASLTVVGLMLLFVAWFSAYSIRLHDAHLTHKSDLGQIDQAIWNTAHGRFVQSIREDQLSTRMTDHVEPIFLPVSLVFWAWDDVRALLVLQAVALAAGAWPIYLFTRKKLSAVGVGANAEGGAVVFAAAYLLMPAVQAATVAEFHAMPLAAPLIAAVLWACEERRWGWFALWAVSVMAVQEGAALLGAALGAYAAIVSYVGAQNARRNQVSPRNLVSLRSSGVLVGAGIFLVGLAWFSIATFVIIPHFAAETYALDQTPYAARYGALGDSFKDVLVSLVTRPMTVLRIALEPLRVSYLLGLLIPTAGLALLCPGLLLVSAPLLLANLLSSFPLQYSGESHYSAALAPFFAMAAASGAARVLCSLKKHRGWTALTGERLSTFIFGVVAVCALTYQVTEGFTPVGGEFRRSPSQGWPEVTAHQRLLARFIEHIPADAAVSTTPALYPHLSHRQYIYLFPIIGDADTVLVDVAGTTDMHPNDVKAKVEQLSASGEFAVIDAADGYLLLARGAGSQIEKPGFSETQTEKPGFSEKPGFFAGFLSDTTLPDAFFDFVRAQKSAQHPLDVTFGGQLRLLGYDVVDNPKWRLTRFRFYWQISEPLPSGVTLGFEVLTPSGSVVDDAALRPMPALLWYPPERWQSDEIVVTESVAWYLPRAWAAVLTVTAGSGTLWPEIGAGSAGQDVAIAPDGRLRLPPWVRREGALTPLIDAPYSRAEKDVRFTDGAWMVRLAEWAAPVAAAPGHLLPVALHWRASGPAGQDYSVFLHLRDATGRTVAQGDAGPTWFIPRPSSHWDAAVGDAGGQWTAHMLTLSDDLLSGRYELVVGWYDWQTGARLSVSETASQEKQKPGFFEKPGFLGNAAPAMGSRSGEEHVLGSVTIAAKAEPRPDIACLLLPESCAALE